MNNSFEQLNTNQRNPKYIINTNDNLKKQAKINLHKYKVPSYFYNDNNNQTQSYYSSVISNSSLNKNNQKLSNSKSNQKKNKKQQSLNKKINKLNTPYKKCTTIQLTKKQKQIRQAIQYRYQRSKLKNYKLSHNTNSQNKSYPDQQIRQILDFQQQETFSQIYSSLLQLKTVNLYQYHKKNIYKFNKPQKQSNTKIIVIKNNKKKRQNSESLIQLNYSQNQMKINSKYFANNNTSQFSNKNNCNLKSQRINIQSVQDNYKNKSQFQFKKNFKIQFLKNFKNLNKNKSTSKSKILKTQNSNYQSETGIKGKKQKIYLSSSVQKNFKSIKDIYLNALTNLANKNTVKNNKLIKNNNMDIKKKQQKILSNGNDKMQSKNNLRNSINYERLASNHHSSSLIKPPNNYISCISSSRQQNLKESKNNSFYNNNKNNSKLSKQKLQKTLLISQANPAQWKSIILKIEDEQNENCIEQVKKNITKKNLKIKTKYDSFCANLNKNQKKGLIHPNSHRQSTKSPKYKRFIITEQQQYNSARADNYNRRNLQINKQIKNLNIISKQKQIKIPHSSICKDTKGLNKIIKK